jgi:hypothetical protein
MGQSNICLIVVTLSRKSQNVGHSGKLRISLRQLSYSVSVGVCINNVESNLSENGTQCICCVRA